MAAAARSLNITAAAVAQRIRTLEIELETTLLVRSGQKVVPTKSCLALMPRIERIVNDTRSLKDDITGRELRGTLRVGAISTALGDYMPKVISQFSELAPQARLTILPGTSQSLYAQLFAGEIDAALIVKPSFEVPKKVKLVSIETQKFVLISKRDDQRQVLEILKTDRVLLYDPSSWGGRLVNSWLAQNVSLDQVLCELDALETIAALVAQGLGTAIVPDWVGLSDLRGVKRHAVPTLKIERELVLLCRDPKSLMVQLLLDSLDVSFSVRDIVRRRQS